MGFVGSITIVVVLALAGVGALRVANLPYLPLIHGSTADEVKRLAAWLDVQPGTRVADLGAGDGRFALALARIVGPFGHIYATELNDERVAGIRQAATKAGVANVTAIQGAVASTRLPEACCDAVFSRAVYHHLTDSAAVNADLFRALRPGGRLVIIDFEPGGIMDWIGRPDTAARHGGHGAPRETVVKELTAAGFQVVRASEAWRGRTYGVLFRRP